MEVDWKQAETMKGALSAGQLWSLDPERAWVRFVICVLRILVLLYCTEIFRAVW